jgi:hypothetical protein
VFGCLAVCAFRNAPEIKMAVIGTLFCGHAIAELGAPYPARTDSARFDLE